MALDYSIYVEIVHTNGRDAHVVVRVDLLVRQVLFGLDDLAWAMLVSHMCRQGRAVAQIDAASIILHLTHKQTHHLN